MLYRVVKEIRYFYFGDVNGDDFCHDFSINDIVEFTGNKNNNKYYGIIYGFRRKSDNRFQWLRSTYVEPIDNVKKEDVV